MMNLAGEVGKRFDQIPFVSEGIPKHHDLAMGFHAWFFQKLDSRLLEPCVVAREIIGFQDEEDAATRLVADCP